MNQTRQGYLLVADITGYTMFLSQSELEHAQEILGTLLELLIQHTRPPLQISRLAGDAVISYALQGSALHGQTFVELIEDTYVAFRRAIELMVLNNHCRCNACANIAALDLKFFVHYGTFAIQHLSAHDELVGNDVNLLHRLLKNRVTEQTGIRAYTLYTNTALQQLGLEGMCEGMRGHEERYEHLGEIQLWLQDMHPIWEERKSIAHLTIPPDQVSLQVAADIAMPPHQVWGYLGQPEFRSILMGADRQVILNRRHGRIAPGTVFQCFHGNRMTTQTLLVWQPFEQMTSQDLTPVPSTYVLTNLLLNPTETGTRLVQQFSKSNGPWWGRLLCDFALRTMAKGAQRDIDSFKAHIEADLATRTHAPSSASTLG
ncbi:MAG TPA: DUF2652 domain-containing protein [Caldilineaceae bacterium]|nr:DUF2652 domain-containing protein [Caldilineaceae bacterium]